MSGRIPKKVAIVGAGPSGLSLLRAFALAEKKGAKIPELVCFEKQEDWGGMWRYSWKTGVDEHGDPVHSSMYKFLWTNAPKEVTEFSDYTYDQHFGKAVPSFLTREETMSYFLGRMKSCEDDNIRKYIRFNKAVRQVEFKPQEDLFTIQTEDLVSRQFQEEQFDHIVLASGRYSTPNIPLFEGIDQFPGRISHSHDFRDAREYVGQNVLVIGNGFSGEDIALQLHKFGAKSITISYRTKAKGFNWPENVKEVPLVSHFQGKTVHFKDGTQREVDCVILCTGYRLHYPFMSRDIRLYTEELLIFPEHLYKGLFFLNQPRVAYMGAHRFSYGQLGLDIQAWYLRDVLLGRIPLEMDGEFRAKDVAEWIELGNAAEDFKDVAVFVHKYLKELVADVKDYPRIDLDGALPLFVRLYQDKLERVVDFRDRVYTSLYTGTTAVENKIPWINADKD